MTGPGTGDTAKGAWGHRPPGTAVTVRIAETADIRGVSCSVSFFPQESERRGLRNRGFPPGVRPGWVPRCSGHVPWPALASLGEAQPPLSPGRAAWAWAGGQRWQGFGGRMPRWPLCSATLGKHAGL